jgi:hypothetical protein
MIRKSKKETQFFGHSLKDQDSAVRRGEICRFQCMTSDKNECANYTSGYILN